MSPIGQRYIYCYFLEELDCEGPLQRSEVFEEGIYDNSKFRRGSYLTEIE